jgi:integrase
LERKEAAALIWHCWRYREKQTIHVGSGKGKPVFTTERPLRHIARFILIGIYTGTRAGAIATASPHQEEGRSFVDLDRGIFYRKAIGKRATKKRQTPAPVPPRLLVHMRRWSRLKLIASCFVEFNGKPIASVKKGFKSGVRLAGLSGKVTPHTLRHTADATRGSALGSRRLPRNVGRSAARQLRPPSSRLHARGSKCHYIEDTTGFGGRNGG